MFSKNSKEPETAPAVQPQAPAPKRGARTGVPSIISGDLTVVGMLLSTGDVQIDGKVEGDVRAGALVIGEKATIDGEIQGEEVVVRGRVHGSIRAHKVQLCSTAHVEGNILHQALSMEAGAFFEGNCRHSDSPLADEQPAARPADRAPLYSKPAAPAHVPAAPLKSPNGTHGEAAAAAQSAKPAPASFQPIKS